MSSLGDQPPWTSHPPLEHQHWPAHSVLIMHPLPDSPYDDSTHACTERRSAWRRRVLSDTLVETNHEHLLPSEDQSSLPHALVQSQVTQSAVLPVLLPPLHTLPSDTRMTASFESTVSWSSIVPTLSRTIDRVTQHGAVPSRSNPREVQLAHGVLTPLVLYLRRLAQDRLNRDSDSYQTHGLALTDLHTDPSPHPTQRNTPQVSHIADPIVSQRSTSAHLHRSRPQFPGPLIVPTRGKSPPAPPLVPRIPHPGRLVQVRSNVHPNTDDRGRFNIDPTSGASRTTSTPPCHSTSFSNPTIPRLQDSRPLTSDNPTNSPITACSSPTSTPIAAYIIAPPLQTPPTLTDTADRHVKTSGDLADDVCEYRHNKTSNPSFDGSILDPAAVASRVTMAFPLVMTLPSTPALLFPQASIRSPLEVSPTSPLGHAATLTNLGVVPLENVPTPNLVKHVGSTRPRLDPRYLHIHESSQRTETLGQCGTCPLERG
ncbi:hypothetical protein EDB83DRAFT_2518378 [Lactarius deliciosus]|nr:hypothetical protein EDB83DRAFT_2518378 [Lactarius deliciosus]